MNYDRAAYMAQNAQNAAIMEAGRQARPVDRTDEVLDALAVLTDEIRALRVALAAAPALAEGAT